MITTTPQEFAEQRARDLLLCIIATQTLRQEANPADAARQWKGVFDGSLKPTLHPLEQEHAEKFFDRILDVALSNATVPDEL